MRKCKVCCHCEKLANCLCNLLTILAENGHMIHFLNILSCIQRRLKLASNFQSFLAFSTLYKDCHSQSFGWKICISLIYKIKLFSSTYMFLKVISIAIMGLVLAFCLGNWLRSFCTKPDSHPMEIMAWCLVGFPYGALFVLHSFKYQEKSKNLVQKHQLLALFYCISQ